MRPCRDLVVVHRYYKASMALGRDCPNCIGLNVHDQTLPKSPCGRAFFYLPRPSNYPLFGPKYTVT